jgi:glycosyltransferase involved in cell wall biosynthesis
MNLMTVQPNEIRTGSAFQVSVVIPTYNRAADVKRALDSVLSQTFPVIEIIVVDDGSTDNTREVVADFGEHVRYIYKQNAGLSKARNTGIQAATCDWVAFLDSDDWWFPKKIQMQADAIKRNPEADLIYTSGWAVAVDGTRTLLQAADPTCLWPGLRYSNLLTGGPSSVMIRRDVLLAVGGFNESLVMSEDWELWVRLIQKHAFTFVSEPVTGISITPNSMSQNPEKTIAGAERIMESPLLDGLQGVKRVIWRRRIRASQIFHAAITAREFDRAHGRRLLLRSLAQWPSPFFLFKRWKALAVGLLGRKFDRPSRPEPANILPTSGKKSK